MDCFYSIFSKTKIYFTIRDYIILKLTPLTFFLKTALINQTKMENLTNQEQDNRAANNQLRIKMNDRYRKEDLKKC